MFEYDYSHVNVSFSYKKLYNSAIQQLNADDLISDESEADSEEME